tara:strand:- start:7192 stop:7632 length:441 start_codon:yes stop_codon:yes gene_type:complete
MFRILLTVLFAFACNLNLIAQTPRTALNSGREIFFTSYYSAGGTYSFEKDDYEEDFEDFTVTKIILKKDRLYSKFGDGEIKMVWLVFDDTREWSCTQCWRLENSTSLCYNYCEDSLAWYFEYSIEHRRWLKVMLFTKLNTVVRESD